jgi:hypothetical protein
MRKAPISRFPGEFSCLIGRTRAHFLLRAHAGACRGELHMIVISSTIFEHGCRSRSGDPIGFRAGNYLGDQNAIVLEDWCADGIGRCGYCRRHEHRQRNRRRVLPAGCDRPHDQLQLFHHAAVQGFIRRYRRGLLPRSQFGQQQPQRCVRLCAEGAARGERRPPRQCDEQRQLEHDPEKWIPVFRKDHALAAHSFGHQSGRADDSLGLIVFEPSLAAAITGHFLVSEFL